jgi:hypothetical protein
MGGRGKNAVRETEGLERCGEHKATPHLRCTTRASVKSSYSDPAGLVALAPKAKVISAIHQLS